MSNVVNSEILLEEIVVSVVVTAYNHEHYISDCINSIMSQRTNFEYEVLLGIEYSKDNTLEVCYGLKEKYPELRIFENTIDNVSLSIAGERLGRMNFLNVLKDARGKYIATCDGDDFWLGTDKLQRQVNEFEKNPGLSLVFSNRKILVENQFAENNVELEDRFYDLKDVQHGLVAFSQTTICRNESGLYDFLLLNKDIQGGDYLITLYSVMHGKLLYMKDHCAGVYRRNPYSSYSPRPLSERYAKTLNQLLVLQQRMGWRNEGFIRRKFSRDIVDLLCASPKESVKYLKSVQVGPWFYCRSFGNIILSLIQTIFFMIYRGLKSRVVKALRKNLNSGFSASYSQSGEDMILKFYFESLNKRMVSYLDIGANHPIKFSNTYYFYRHWKSIGVLVEPNPALHDTIVKRRSRDILIPYGIGLGEQKESADYFVMAWHEFNTFSESIARETQMKYAGRNDIQKKLRIDLLPINEILNEHFSRGIDLLSIDVEGMDLEIIKTIDFKRHRPLAICIETKVGDHFNSDETETYLKSCGYKLYALTPINGIFIPIN